METFLGLSVMPWLGINTIVEILILIAAVMYFVIKLRKKN